ncbi:MAG TPA: MopE-related protein [Solirubrobacteraceae bacterium]|nr:MopE-related protein [Solirubrobacteraceae bacterium]
MRPRTCALAVILASVVGLAAASPAQGGTLVRGLGGLFPPTFVWTYTATDDLDDDNTITIAPGDTETTFELRDTGDTISVGICNPVGCGCTNLGAGAVRCPTNRSLTVHAGPGDDSVKVEPASFGYTVALFGEAGADDLSGGDRDDVLDGGSGDDEQVAGQQGNDLIRGGSGRDDNLAGGVGTDTLSYDDGRVQGVLVSLATRLNSDLDEFSSIESVQGGAGADDLTGSSGANTISGLGGNDVLVGGIGFDTLSAGAGADTVDAIDGGQDSIDCGADGDTARADLIDALAGCETVGRPDSDGDGFGDDVDCSIGNPAVNPGAAEVPDNDVDENCDGILVHSTPPDNDGDGFAANLDCNDSNPKIRPGAVEIPGNRVDENCDRRRPDFPLIPASIAMFVRSDAASTLVTDLTITRVPAGARVVLRCRPPSGRSKACPFKRLTRKFAKARRRVSLRAAFEGRRLPVGTRVDVRVLAPKFIGKVRIERVGRFKTTRKLLCQRPGTSKPRRCPGG